MSIKNNPAIFNFTTHRMPTSKHYKYFFIFGKNSIYPFVSISLTFLEDSITFPYKNSFYVGCFFVTFQFYSFVPVLLSHFYWSFKTNMIWLILLFYYREDPFHWKWCLSRVLQEKRKIFKFSINIFYRNNWKWNNCFGKFVCMVTGFSHQNFVWIRRNNFLTIII